MIPHRTCDADVSYVCRARGSVLRGKIVVRAASIWPRGRNGNVLVAGAYPDETLYVVPGRTLRGTHDH